MRLEVIREPVIHVQEGENYTPGKMYANGLFFCFTCEDEDRQLEVNPEGKVYGRTCVPRGTFTVENSWSHHFQKLLPSIVDIPGFSGVKFHGGNRAEQSLGCILIGKVRTNYGIAQCPDMVQRLISLIQACEDKGEEVTVTIK